MTIIGSDVHMGCNMQGKYGKYEAWSNKKKMNWWMKMIEKMKKILITLLFNCKVELNSVKHGSCADVIWKQTIPQSD